MTVCIGAICRWNYAKKGEPLNPGPAILMLSDRMITVGNAEYEPAQQKFGPLSSTAWLVIAGDFATHSQAILDTRKQIATASLAIQNVASIYGQCIQRIKLRMAEDEILAPLGLNSDTFIAQQREMSPSLVDSLAAQLQHYEGEEVEAIIGGTEGGGAHLYYIDNKGSARCFDDVGFAAIGFGAWHARSRLTQARYVNTVPYIRALAMTYAAKKAGELAPGVGTQTDIHIIFRTGAEALLPSTKTKLEELFNEYETERLALAERTVQKLSDFLAASPGPAPPQDAKRASDKMPPVSKASFPSARRRRS